MYTKCPPRLTCKHALSVLTAAQMKLVVGEIMIVTFLVIRLSTMGINRPVITLARTTMDKVSDLASVPGMYGWWALSFA